MIRIFLENIALFLLPTVAYLAYVMLARRSGSGPARVLDGAPLLWLFAAGAAIVIVTLASMSSRTGGKPGEVYQPSIIKDGHIVPADHP